MLNCNMITVRMSLFSYRPDLLRDPGLGGNYRGKVRQEPRNHKMALVVFIEA